MTPERWKQVEAIFERALELADGERDEFIHGACGDDHELRDEVASLIRSDVDARAHLHEAVAAEIGHLSNELAPTKVGQRVGPYLILELVAEGGMGEVFLAQRSDAEFERRVAIKFLQRGSYGADSIARLRDERQILATLDHPNIVRLIDGGTTDEGLPYLVMDYIEGVPLTRYARDHELAVRPRVEMFVDVCAAVQYAHQKLVVHRDLKPSNILVDATGKPRLLDFGIAKLLDPIAERSREAKTGTGMALLTPEYASPEQVRGDPVTVAADVYSLGAVLYELLVDRPALPKTTSGLEMLRMICEVDPPRPSTQAPRERRASIAGDLDNIVGKALQKAPAQRYASVAQLADDLVRYLTGRPVLARTATFYYRSTKFLRRHWAKVALAVAATATLAGSTAMSFVQARRANEAAHRAERRFDEVRALARSLLFELDPKLRDLTGATAARAFVVERALEYLDRLASEAHGDVALEREVALAYMRVGDIQGNPYEPNLGKHEDALVSYAKARAIIAQLPDDIERRKLSEAASFGTAFFDQALGRFDAIATELHDAFAIVDGLPSDQVDPPLVARGYSCMLQRDIDIADVASAERDAAAMTAFVGAWHQRDNSPVARYWYGITANSVGRVKLWLADPDAGIEADRPALAELDKLASEFPDDLRYARERALTLWLVSGAYSGFGDNWDWSASTGDLATGEHAARDAADIAHQITAHDRNDVRALDDEATITSTLAALVASRSPADGIDVFARSLAVWDQVPPTERTTHYDRVLEYFAHCAMAEPLARVGRFDEAHAQILAGLALLASEPADSVTEERANCIYHRAITEHVRGDDSAATASLDEVIAALQHDVDTRSLKISRYLGLVRSLELRATTEPRTACASRARAIAAWQAWPGGETAFMHRIRGQLGTSVCKP